MKKMMYWQYNYKISVSVISTCYNGIMDTHDIFEYVFGSSKQCIALINGEQKGNWCRFREPTIFERK